MRVMTAVLALVLGVGVSAQEEKKDPKEADEAAKAKVADFKKELKACKTDQDVSRAIENLGALQHARVLAELKTWLSKPSAEICIAAAREISRYPKDKDASDTLLAAVGNRKDKETQIKLLKYVGEVGFRPAASKLTGFFRHRDADIAREAVDSCGKLKSRDAMEPLLALLKELDAIRDQNDPVGVGNVGGLGGGLGGGIVGGTNNEQTVRKSTLTPGVQRSLGDITNQNFKTAKEWEDWWRKNKGTFKELD
jgi:hypothetical protein